MRVSVTPGDVSIGTALVAARTACSMSIDDIARAMKRPARVVALVEREAWSDLPNLYAPGFYVRALVSDYARLVNLDISWCLASLASQCPATTHAPAAFGAAEPPTRPR